MHYFINIARNKLKFACLKLRLTHVFNFKWRRRQPCRWLSGTNNCVKAHVGDVIIVWRNTHDNIEPDAIWFPATLTGTDLNIQGIQVKYRTNGNCNIPATESRLWGTKWYHLFSAHVRMLRRGAFGIFYTTIFNWTFKNCVSSRGSSKGYVHWGCEMGTVNTLKFGMSPIIIPRGGILVSLRPSVSPSVPLSRIPCPLSSAYSSGWIHFIFIHLIKQLQKY